jgi:DNA-binding transcriptional ArsR family regulator
MAGRDHGRLPETSSDIHALRSGRAVMELPLDAVFTVLATRRRRILLRVLDDADACSVGDLVEWVAARERQLDGEPPDREALRSELERVHLSMLADHRILDYDTRSGNVRYYGHPVVEEYLEHAADFE